MKQQEKQKILDFTNQIDESTDCAISFKMNKQGEVNFCFEGNTELREYFYYRVIKALNNEIFKNIDISMSKFSASCAILKNLH